MKSKKSIKVIILTPDLSVPGGVGNYYSTLELDKIENFKYFPVNKKSLIRIFTFYRLIKNYISFTYLLIKKGYKTILVNPSLTRNSFYRDALFVYIGITLNRNTIVFFRGWSEEFEDSINNNKFLSLILNKTYAKASKFIILGNIFKEKLINMGVSENAEFILETTVADSTHFKNFNPKCKFHEKDKPIVFLFLSRILKEKGIYIAIEAFNLFCKNNPSIDSKLLIAGDGIELLNVRNYVKGNKIKNITFLGHVSGLTKINTLKESNILLFPSYSEGLPNSVLECMLYGMPIIGRNVGGLPEIIKNGKNGFLTESFDPQIFANLMTKTYTNPLIFNLIVENNYKLAKEKFTSEVVKSRIIKLLLSGYAD